MKNTTTLLLTVLCSGTVITSPLAQQMYRGVDAEGNAVFSDKPFDNAEDYTPPHITVMDATPVPARDDEPLPEEDTVATEYKLVQILSPKNQQTIWNEPDLWVQVRSIPVLDVTAGDRYWLIMDGKPLVKGSRRPQLPIGRADRGEHKLQVQIRNRKNRIVKRSPVITVHIKNSVVPRKAPR